MTGERLYLVQFRQTLPQVLHIAENLLQVTVQALCCL